jgi:hypothetical protein
MATDSQEQQQQLEEVMRGLRMFTDSTYASRVQLDQLRDSEMKTRYGLNNFTASTKMGADAVASLAKTATSYVNSMYNGQRGFSAMSDSLNNLSTAAKVAGGALMLLGGPIGIVVGGMTILGSMAVDAANELGKVADASFDAYKSLSEVGVAASDGITGLTGAFVQMGAATKNFDKAAQLLAENNKELALFGGTVFQGRKRFADLSAEFSDFREPMLRLGYEVEGANRALMSYVIQQNRYGFLTGQSTKEMAGAAKAYIMEQEALTKLTGLSRREQERALEQQMGRERFAGEMLALQQSGQKDLADTYKSIFLTLEGMNAPELAKGFADALSDPFGMTEDSVKLMRLTQGASVQIIQDLREGNIGGAEAMTRLQAAIGKTTKELGPSLGRIGTFTSTFGPLNEAMKITAAGAGDLGKAYEQAQNETRKTAENNDSDVTKQARMRDKQQRQATEIFQKLNEIMPFVTSGLELFGDALSYSVDQLLSFVDFISERFGKSAEQQAAEKARENAFEGASFQQRTLGIGLSDKQKQANEQVRKARELQEIQRALEGKAYNQSELVRQASYESYGGDERRKEDIAKAEKLKSELASLVKDLGMEDVRAKMAAAKTARDQRARQREQDAARREQRGTSAAAATGALPPAGAAPVSQDQLKAMGLKFQPGRDVQRNDMAVSPRMLEMAKKLQDNLQGFKFFTAFNDNYHHDQGLAGDHTRGQAIDFILDKHPTKAEGQRIIAQLKSMGFDTVLDEYNNRSKNATGGHIHAAIKEFAEGGILKYQPGGHVVKAAEAGYDEAFIPLKNGTVPVTVNGLNLDQEVSNAIGKAFETNNTTQLDNMKSLATSFQQSMTEAVNRLATNNEVFERMLAASQEMIRTQRESNSLQSKMLQAVSN